MVYIGNQGKLVLTVIPSQQRQTNYLDLPFFRTPV